MELLHNKTLDALTFLGNIEKQMVEESEGKPGNPAFSTESVGQTENGPEIQYTHLASPFNTAPARDFLMPGCSVRQEMNAVLAEYMNYVTPSHLTRIQENLRSYWILRSICQGVFLHKLI